MKEIHKSADELKSISAACTMIPRAVRITQKPDIDEDTIRKWQRIVDLMARACQVPVGLIMRIDLPHIEVFVSSATDRNPYEKEERAVLDTGLYCETVIKKRLPLLVADALKDPEWDHNPDIRLGLTYYCGFPITWPNGDIFGTLCILDYSENTHATAQRELIAEFCEVIERDLNIAVYSSERETILADLQREITERKKVETEREKLINDLQDALAQIKTLQGILPICMFCKKIRDDKDCWHRLEAYISDRSEAQFSHGICPECAKEHGYD
jgi:transcriptional regulator with GAF, ATPase, and Fis domain